MVRCHKWSVGKCCYFFNQEWVAKQEAMKNEEIEITFSYWDGSGHRRSVRMKKGKSIKLFKCFFILSHLPYIVFLMMLLCSVLGSLHFVYSFCHVALLLFFSLTSGQTMITSFGFGLPVVLTVYQLRGCNDFRSILSPKGNSVYQFLQRGLEILRKEFNELRSVSADHLMYIKEDLIIPHHYTFYDFIVNKVS